MYICVLLIKTIEIMTRTEAVNYLKGLCSNHVNTQVLDECVGRLNELGWFSEEDEDERGNVKFINAFTKANVKACCCNWHKYFTLEDILNEKSHLLCKTMDN